MFPIIPAHMLNGTPSTSLAKMTINPAGPSYSSAFWNVWTEDFLRRKYISAASSDYLTNHSIESIVEPIDAKSKQTVRDVCRDVKGSSEVKASKGSYAIETIPKDSKTRPVDCIDVTAEQVVRRKTFISIDSSGYITNDQHYSESAWIRSLSLAHDTYSHNAQLEITSDHRLRVNIVKNLVIDEEIQLWFSDEILSMLAVPFLTLPNILGKNCYKCVECNKTYENPNPLKIHLATNCDRYTIDDLWSRLNNIVSSLTVFRSIHDIRRSSAQRRSENCTTLAAERLNANIPFVPSSSPYSFTSQSSPSPSYHQLPNVHQLSAFQPFSVPLPRSNLFMSRPLPELPDKSLVMKATMSSSSNPSIGVEKGSVAVAAAQLETIVSNMGTSKQGHVCIYCGKLYSRKYGLKIHIRTHTGFKPLKCKYCLRPFGDPSNLNKHIRLHVQEKSLYKCHLCSKVLVRRRDLLRHMSIKHNVAEPNDGQFSRECDNDNTTISSPNRCNDSSRSNSVNSNSTSNDEGMEDDDDFDVRVDDD